MNILKKLWDTNRFLIVGSAIIILFILFFLILALFSGSKSISFNSLEVKLEKAAEKYYSNNKELLPQDENDLVSVSAETLIYGNYIKDLSEYRKEKCSAYVEVEYQKKDEYFYQAYLDCGEEYNTQKFSNIINNIDLVDSGDGLYQINNEKIFRGQLPNNYVEINLDLETDEKGKVVIAKNAEKRKQYSSSIWRILKIDAENKVYLILDAPDNEDRSVWDDRYNTEVNKNYGINEYGGENKNSRLYTFVNTAYNVSPSLHDNIKNYLAPFDLCTGKRAVENNTKTGLSECNIILKDQYIGLLPLYEYMRASLDESCVSSLDAQCQNYNYLAIDKSWWTLTGVSANTYESYLVDSRGRINAENSSQKGNIRYVIALNKHVLYNGGDGSKNNPYKITI